MLLSYTELESLLIERARMLAPTPTAPGDGFSATTQLDAVLISAGFKLSANLFNALSRMDPGEVIDQGVRLVEAVKQLVGANVQHNVYFAKFPYEVPDTLEFWRACLVDALERVVNQTAGADPYVFGVWEESEEQAEAVAARLSLIFQGPEGKINLLALPMYGTPQHTYEQLEEVHSALIESVKDRLTIIHLAPYVSTYEAIRAEVYFKLAGSPVPLAAEDLELFKALALRYQEGDQPESIPVRENRAVLNRIRLAHRRPLVVDTVTDVLRLAAVCSPQPVEVDTKVPAWLRTAALPSAPQALEDGDVSLQRLCKFRTFSRPERRVLMTALEGVVAGDARKLGDVHQYYGRWIRLQEKLKPHEYPELHHAQLVFVAARGGMPGISDQAEVETRLAAGNAAGASILLRRTPGRLYRAADHLLRLAGSENDLGLVIRDITTSAEHVSGRVLLSLREHIQNRDHQMATRIFVNRNGRAWVTDDKRAPLSEGVRDELCSVLDSELIRRMPIGAGVRLLVDRDILGVALPLSMKTMPAGGFGVMPRGSVSAPLEHDTLRYFAHWMEAERTTDYDLSGLLLDETFGELGHVSWTQYRAGNAFTYSGDITYAPAPHGATEHIDCWLPQVQRGVRYVVPQLNIYSGEDFDKAAECFMGYMERDRAQAGLPYEPRTVRFKSDVRGSGKVALPFILMRGDDGKWRVKWLHLYLKGSPVFNMVEGNKVTTALQARAIVERNYLRVSYLANLLAIRSGAPLELISGSPMAFEHDALPIHWIGLDRPQGLPTGSRVVTLPSLMELIPE